VSSESASAGGSISHGEALPRGPHRLPRDVVLANQRRRLLGAAAQVLARHGYAQLTVEQIHGAAGVSRTTFYEHFTNKQDCVLVAHEDVFDRFTGELFRACAERPEWSGKVRAGVETTIAFSVRCPEEAQLLLVDPVAADPYLATRVLASHDYLTGLLRNGREHCPEAGSLPELTERALLGAAASVVGSRLISGQADRLAALEPQLVQLMLMPYLGVTEARRIAERADS
jgi:AcrR family transcriptional regulator